MTKLLEQVKRTLTEHRMLPDAGTIVLAVSGGPDSLALLHLMHDALRDRRGLRMHVAHLHHGMRGRDADADAEFVRNEALRLGAGFSIRHADVPKLAERRKVGVEVAGRDARYSFFAEVAQQIGAERIALGHQLNDQVETLLMRVLRGAGPRGMCGIPYIRRIGGNSGALIIRPLLDCPRKEIEQYVSELGIIARTDSTNYSQKYLRNRLRSQVMPKMADEWGDDFAEEVASLARTAQRLRRQCNAFCRRLIARNDVEFSDGSAETSAAWLRALPESVLAEVLQSMTGQENFCGKMLSASNYEAIAGLIAQNAGELSLPGNISANVWRDIFIIREKKHARPPKFSAELCVPGATSIAELGGRFECDIVDCSADSPPQKDGFDEILDAEAVKQSLSVRLPRPGDRFRPLGAPGTKKLHDIFIDLHIPPWRRARLPLVIAGDKIVWAVGVRIADEVKVTQSTKKILRLKYFPAKAHSVSGTA